MDDKFFINTNQYQYIWYNLQINQDEKEQYELLRDIAEHNAMFWNADGVNQVREGRKNTFSTNPEDFEASIKEMFGRDINDESGTDNPEDFVRQNRVSEKAKAYLDMELDDISFTPIRGG